MDDEAEAEAERPQFHLLASLIDDDSRRLDSRRRSAAETLSPGGTRVGNGRGSGRGRIGCEKCEGHSAARD